MAGTATGSGAHRGWEGYDMVDRRWQQRKSGFEPHPCLQTLRVAQLVEQLICNQPVPRSSRGRSSKNTLRRVTTAGWVGTDPECAIFPGRRTGVGLFVDSRRMNAPILLALLAFVSGPAFAQSGVLGLPLTPTNCTLPVTLPPPNPGMTRVALTINHTFLQSVGFETDEWNTEGIYSVNAAFLNGWALRAGETALCGRRSTWGMERVDECEPFDGTYDGGGSSGFTVLRDMPTSVTVTLDLAQLTGPLTLRSTTRTRVGMDLSFPVTGPDCGAVCTVITHSKATAAISYQYL